MGLLLWQHSAAHPYTGLERGCFGHDAAWTTHGPWLGPKEHLGGKGGRLAAEVSRAVAGIARLNKPLWSSRGLNSSSRPWAGPEVPGRLLDSALLLALGHGVLAGASLCSQSQHKQDTCSLSSKVERRSPPSSHSLLPRSCHFCATDLRGKTEPGERAMASKKQGTGSSTNNKPSTRPHFARHNLVWQRWQRAALQAISPPALPKKEPGERSAHCCCCPDLPRSSAQPHCSRCFPISSPALPASPLCYTFT